MIHRIRRWWFLRPAYVPLPQVSHHTLVFERQSSWSGETWKTVVSIPSDPTSSSLIQKSNQIKAPGVCVQKNILGLIKSHLVEPCHLPEMPFCWREKPSVERTYEMRCGTVCKEDMEEFRFCVVRIDIKYCNFSM